MGREDKSRAKTPSEALPKVAFKRKMSTRVARSVGGPYIESIGRLKLFDFLRSIRKRTQRGAGSIDELGRNYEETAEI